VHPFAGLVSVCEGGEEFLTAVEKSLAVGDLAGSAARRAEAARHTWDARVEMISEKLAAFLQA
jgi:hypothetical protein